MYSKPFFSYILSDLCLTLSIYVSGSFSIHTYKNTQRHNLHLDWTCVEFIISLRRTNIFVILSLQMHEHSCSMEFEMFLQIKLTKFTGSEEFLLHPGLIHWLDHCDGTTGNQWNRRWGFLLLSGSFPLFLHCGYHE